MNNIVELLIREVRKHPEQIAFIQGKRQISYAAFWQRVLRRVKAYQDRGLGRGDRVLVFVPMSIDLYEILCALFHLGCPAVFLDAWATRERLEISMKLASCKGCIMIPKAWLLLLRSREMRRIPIKLFPGTMASEASPLPPEPDGDLALVTFTTGSTGIPKAARRTHRFLMEQQRILAKEMNLPTGTVDMATLPIFALGNLASGLTTLIPAFDMRHPGTFNPRPVIEEARLHHAASTCASPAFFTCLMKGLNPGETLPELKRLATGGATVDPAFARKLMEAFPEAEATAIYGSTEAEPIAAVPMAELAGQDNIANGILTGRVVPDVKMAILPLDKPIQHEYSVEEWEKLKLPADSVGEICVAGPHVLKEYLDNPQAFRENKILTGNEIYHRTGDAGRLDSKGNLYLYGRASTAFKDKGGKWTFTMLCEVALKGIPGISAGTILMTNQGVTAFLESTLSQKQAEESLKKAGIAFQILQIMKHIPRDPRHNSKIDYGALREIVKCMER